MALNIGPLRKKYNESHTCGSALILILSVQSSMVSSYFQIPLIIVDLQKAIERKQNVTGFTNNLKLLLPYDIDFAICQLRMLLLTNEN